MIRFVRYFCLKIGITFLLSYTGFVTLGSIRTLLTTILLITISTYIAEFLSEVADNMIHSFLIASDTTIYISIISIILSGLFLIIIPCLIISFTHGIQIENGFIIFAVVCILWIIGYVPKENKED